MQKVEFKICGINSVIILRRLQLKVHIRETERISSRLEQEEVVVSTRGINKEIVGLFQQVNPRQGAEDSRGYFNI